MAPLGPPERLPLPSVLPPTALQLGPVIAYIPAINVAELTATYSTPDGQIAVNVFHVKNSVAWTVTTLTQLANVYITWESATTLGVNPAANRSSAVSLVNVKARDLTTQTSPEVTVGPSGGPVVGGDASGTLPNGVTVAVKWGTGTPGRAFRGRTFWIGMAQDQLLSSSKNTLSSAFGVSVVVAYNNLKAAIKASSSGFDLCVLSASFNLVPRNPRIPTVITTASLVDQFLDYQRRRAPAHNRGG